MERKDTEGPVFSLGETLLPGRQGTLICGIYDKFL